MSDVHDFGAAGDGKADDSEAIQHAVQTGDGCLEFPAGVFRISRPIDVPLNQHGPVSISGCGATKILMTGPGPAFRLTGTHGGTGSPTSVKPEIWTRQRMPTIQNLEIEGDHPEADGLELVETMQAVLSGVLIRQCRHGVRLRKRNRNVLITGCHIYHNTGIGVFLDQVDLHQINIAGSHISYNRLGGIRMERSVIRNLQITGNDIEYNNHRVHDTDPEPTAEIYIDTTAPGASVNEVTIASNTIQATASPEGANIRIQEKPGENRPPGLITITGNVIGSQENNVHLTGCYGVVLSGNTIYSCEHRNLLLEQCRQISITGNVSRRHTTQYQTGMRLEDCTDCVISGCIVHDETETGQASGASLLELIGCRRINVTGSQFSNGVPYGIDADQCRQVQIGACMVIDSRSAPAAEGSIRFRGEGDANRISDCILDAGKGQPKTDLAAEAQVKVTE